ncbi:MAG TPA: hypothetical protein VGK34_07585 [Armatimonadota bacterium]|jgi:hypothetical protein
MLKIQTEWDPNWDDDWRAALTRLENEVEDEHPLNAEQSVELYRFGFSAARRLPMPVWSDVESELYQDYMNGEPEPGETQTQEMSWDESRELAQRGWEAGMIP